MNAKAIQMSFVREKMAEWKMNICTEVGGRLGGKAEWHENDTTRND